MMKNSDLKYYLTSFLAELELNIDSFELTLNKLQEYREFIIQQGIPDNDKSNTKKIKVLARERRQKNQLSTIKSSLFFSDHIVFDDPLIYELNDIETFFNLEGRNKYFGLDSLKNSYLNKIKEVISQMWEVLPFIEKGLVSFSPLRATSKNTREDIKNLCYEYFSEKIEIKNIHQWNEIVEVKIPSMGYSGFFDLTKNADGEFTRTNISKEGRDFYTFHFLTVFNALSLSDEIGGTFFSSLDWHWNLANHISNDLSSDIYTYKFLKDIVSPDVNKIPVNEYISLLSYDDSLYRFRRELRLSEKLLSKISLSESDTLESQKVFDEVFKPNMDNIESQLSKKEILKDVPWFLASLGLGYTAAIMSGAPHSSAALGAGAALVGASGLYRNLFKSEQTVRQEPSFMLWKIKENIKNQKF